MNFFSKLCALNIDFSYHYQYDGPEISSSLSESEAIALAGVILAFVLVVLLIVAIPFYIFGSLGYYTIAKRRGVKCPGLAWVPLLNYFVIGGIGDDYQKKTTGKDSAFRVWMLVLQCAAIFLSILSLCLLTGSLISLIAQAENEVDFSSVMGVISSSVPMLLASMIALANMVLFYISLYRLFKAANPENAVGFLILCIFVNVATPFIVFALRNKDEGLPRQPDAISAGQG